MNIISYFFLFFIFPLFLREINVQVKNTDCAGAGILRSASYTNLITILRYVIY